MGLTIEITDERLKSLKNLSLRSEKPLFEMKADNDLIHCAFVWKEFACNTKSTRYDGKMDVNRTFTLVSCFHHDVSQKNNNALY